jgi:hypothetical protein
MSFDLSGTIPPTPIMFTAAHILGFNLKTETCNSLAGAKLLTT